MATDERASAGHALNQSMVQHVTRAGNCLRRARNISPRGLKVERNNYMYSDSVIVRK